MAAVNIIIKAVNSTKGAFNEVGRQAADLNKKLSAMSRIFKGLFVAGIAAKFGKSLLEASSYSLELEQSAGRIKKAWQPIGEEIGDAFARIVMSLERPISAVGRFFEDVINGAQKAAAFLVALATTRSFADAKRIADEVLAELEAEQEARRNARAEQDAANTAEEAAAKRISKLYDERYNLLQQLKKRQKEAAEAQLSAVELLEKRERELEFARRRLGANVTVPGLSDEENAALQDVMKIQTEIDIVNLEDEIRRIRKGIKDAVNEADAIDKKRKPGSRLIKFDRTVRGKLADRVQETLRGEGMGDMSRRSMERASKLNDVGPSLETAAHLKKIRDNFETLVQELTR